MHTAVGTNEKTHSSGIFAGHLSALSIIGFGLITLAATVAMIEAGKQAGQLLGM